MSNRQSISTFLGIAAAVVLAAPAPAHAADLLGPSSYESFVEDSPFAGLTFSYFHLEDFEDGLLNTPPDGVSATCGGPICGVTSVVFGPGCHDSVDEDDGQMDGIGLDGDSFWAHPGNLGITFTFDASVLGSLPTHVGIVWTDGPTPTQVVFKAFFAAGGMLTKSWVRFLGRQCLHWGNS